MKRYWTYFKYVMKHKWYVFFACLELGVPLHRAILHDWSKFSSKEFKPYANQFFNADGSRRQVRNVDGSYDPNAQSISFQYAWLSHQRNLHHWQAWISIGDGGNLSALPMPETYLREMLADWKGAGKAINGKDDVVDWYKVNRIKMVLHPDNLAWLDARLLEP